MKEQEFRCYIRRYHIDTKSNDVQEHVFINCKHMIGLLSLWQNNEFVYGPLDASNPKEWWDFYKQVVDHRNEMTHLA